MPTFAKVIAAIYFAALGFFWRPYQAAAGRGHAGCLDERDAGRAWGDKRLAYVGRTGRWRHQGRDWLWVDDIGTDRGLGGVFFFAGSEMIGLSIDRRYDGPIEAIQSMFLIGIGYLKLIAVPEVIGSAIVGGIFGGWLTEWAAARFT